jgi:hypothetical protein
VNIDRGAYKPELEKATPIIDQGASVEHHATLGCDDKLSVVCQRATRFSLTLQTFKDLTRLVYYLAIEM